MEYYTYVILIYKRHTNTCNCMYTSNNKSDTWKYVCEINKHSDIMAFSCFIVAQQTFLWNKIVYCKSIAVEYVEPQNIGIMCPEYNRLKSQNILFHYYDHSALSVSCNYHPETLRCIIHPKYTPHILEQSTMPNVIYSKEYILWA